MISCSVVINSIDKKINLKALKIICDIDEITAVFVAFNGSDKSLLNSLEKDLKHSKKIKFFNIINKGMGNAHNYLLKNNKLDKYHLLLNPDVYVNKDAIKEGLKKLNLEQTIVAVGPKIYNLDNKYWPSVKLLPDPITLIARRIYSRSKKNKLYELNQYEFEEDINVPMISGCYILCRSDILKKIQGFDERFFLYMEDIDLLRRLSENGEICYMPKTQIVHIGNLGSRKFSKMFFLHLVSFIKYYNKWGWFKDNFTKDKNKKFLYYLSSIKINL